MLRISNIGSQGYLHEVPSIDAMDGRHDKAGLQLRDVFASGSRVEEEERVQGCSPSARRVSHGACSGFEGSVHRVVSIGLCSGLRVVSIGGCPPCT